MESKRFILLPIVVEIETELTNVSDIVNSIEVKVNGDCVVSSRISDDYYEFEA